MIYHLFAPLASLVPIFNVTRYITFRSGCAFITSFVFVLATWSYALEWLQKLHMTETIDMYGHKALEGLYAGKKGTPTMGGILIIVAVLFSTLLWARWDNVFIWLSIMTMVGLGALGFADDYLKTKTGKGLCRRDKLMGQILIGLIVGGLVVFNKDMSTTWDFPFFKKIAIDLGLFYIFWAALVIVATSNAVNFTDGLDGLAIGTLTINFFIFGILAYVSGNVKIAKYLFIPYVPGSGELAVLCFALLGAGLGFLWFNAYPAQVFMGDVGALSLGGVIGAIALLIKKEFLLFICGGIFVAEALSVVLQMIWINCFKKKLFKAAPLHHHLQLMGWKENKITVRLWIVAILCGVLTFLTLKLR